MFRRIIEREHKGYALLLGLLIVVVIGIIIYYARLHGPVYEIGKGESDINPPWRQWHKLNVRKEKGETIGKPSAQQPQIAQPMTVATYCTETDNDKRRGDIVFSISDDGSVQGGWGGSFYLNRDVIFDVMACKFKGTIDPKEVYSGENGEDESKLFFIAKGPFSILETNHDTGKVRNIMGEAYLRGWMGTDYRVEGDLIITSDVKNFYRYIWKGQATGGLPLSF